MQSFTIRNVTHRIVLIHYWLWHKIVDFINHINEGFICNNYCHSLFSYPKSLRFTWSHYFSTIYSYWFYTFHLKSIFEITICIFTFHLINILWDGCKNTILICISVFFLLSFCHPNYNNFKRYFRVILLSFSSIP